MFGETTVTLTVDLWPPKSNQLVCESKWMCANFDRKVLLKYYIHDAKRLFWEVTVTFDHHILISSSLSPSECLYQN